MLGHTLVIQKHWRGAVARRRMKSLRESLTETPSKINCAEEEGHSRCLPQTGVFVVCLRKSSVRESHEADSELVGFVEPGETLQVLGVRLINGTVRTLTSLGWVTFRYSFGLAFFEEVVIATEKEKILSAAFEEEQRARQAAERRLESVMAEAAAAKAALEVRAAEPLRRRDAEEMHDREQGEYAAASPRGWDPQSHEGSMAVPEPELDLRRDRASIASLRATLQQTSALLVEDPRNNICHQLHRDVEQELSRRLGEERAGSGHGTPAGQGPLARERSASTRELEGQASLKELRDTLQQTTALLREDPRNEVCKQLHHDVQQALSHRLADLERTQESQVATQVEVVVGEIGDSVFVLEDGRVTRYTPRSDGALMVSHDDETNVRSNSVSAAADGLRSPRLASPANSRMSRLDRESMLSRLEQQINIRQRTKLADRLDVRPSLLMQPCAHARVCGVAPRGARIDFLMLSFVLTEPYCPSDTYVGMEEVHKAFAP